MRCRNQVGLPVCCMSSLSTLESWDRKKKLDMPQLEKKLHVCAHKEPLRSYGSTNL